ncbi:hypothetical protein M23134_04721 [Microscilla marina ATCC 23134]|uniref:Uncharacterized protein n=1 Tax=Microscilla marina ATCC 23134 TaxID=313606 RepID=A1ZRE3_MICM2|nr:hypothetical protein M23134_04721 [Microscilla marina ATCC 23134]
MPEGNETRFYSTTQQISSYFYAVKLSKKSRLICYKKVYGFKTE